MTNIDVGAENSTYLTDPYPPRNGLADYEPSDLSQLNAVPSVLPQPAEYGLVGGLVRSLVPDDLQLRLDSLGEMFNSYVHDVMGRVRTQLNLGGGAGMSSGDAEHPARTSYANNVEPDP